MAQQSPKLGASACVWRSKRVLIVQRANPPFAGMWSLPGGRMEAGETLLQTANRELLEETGIKADLNQLSGVYNLNLEDGSYMIACYTGRWKSGNAVASDDVLTLRWALTEDLEGLDVTPNTSEAIIRAKVLLRL